MRSTDDRAEGPSLKRPAVRKVLDYVGAALGITGTLLLIGSVVVWVTGPELLAEFYERSKPVIPFFLTGMVLLVLGILLAPGAGKANAAASGTGPDAGGSPAGTTCCGKCAARNDGRAKFCNQCGVAL